MSTVQTPRLSLMQTPTSARLHQEQAMPLDAHALRCGCFYWGPGIFHWQLATRTDWRSR